MFIDLHKALERVEENLPKDRRITFEMLEKAYEQTLWLRSHILGVMYDMIDFGSAVKKYPLSFYRKWVRSGISRPLYCIHESFL